jgi:phage gp29-like protein
MRGANEGDAESYLTLAEEIEERYLHYSAQLATRKRAVSGITPEIVPASEDAKAIEIADFVRRFAPLVRGATFNMLDALGKGFSVTEILWDTSGPPGTPFVPRALERIEPRWFQFDKETGQIIRLKSDNSDGEALAPGKFLTLTTVFKSGLPIRGGLARAAAWGYMYANFGVKEWVTFIEQFGKPLRLGRYTAGAVSPADLEKLYEALQGLGMDAAAMLPDNMRIEFPEVANARGENGLWLNLIEYFDRQISKLVLGQTLTADTGQNGGGSFSLGQVHNEVRLDILKDDAEQVAALVNTQFIPLLVSLNFGEQGAYPEYRIPVEDPEDQTALAAIVKDAVAMGQPVGQAWFSRKFSIPLPEEDEPTLQAAAASAPLLEGGGAPAPGGVRARQRQAEHAAAWDAVDRLQKDAAPALNKWIGKLEAMLASAGSLEEFREMLLAAYPDLEPSEMVEALSPAFMSAWLAGVDEAVQRTEDRKVVSRL